VHSLLRQFFPGLNTKIPVCQRLREAKMTVARIHLRHPLRWKCESQTVSMGDFQSKQSTKCSQNSAHSCPNQVAGPISIYLTTHIKPWQQIYVYEYIYICMHVYIYDYICSGIYAGASPDIRSFRLALWSTLGPRSKTQLTQEGRSRLKTCGSRHQHGECTTMPNYRYVYNLAYIMATSD